MERATAAATQRVQSRNTDRKHIYNSALTIYIEICRKRLYANVVDFNAPLSSLAAFSTHVLITCNESQPAKMQATYNSRPLAMFSSLLLLNKDGTVNFA